MPTFTVGLLLAILVLATIFACLRILLYWTQEKNEPPVLGSSIPFLTPVLGILRQRTNFMVQIRNKHYDVPIYTLRLPGSRIYVLNSPSLIPLMQRQKRIIAFEPIPAHAAANIMGVSKVGVDAISHECTEDNSYFNTFIRATHPTLSPGASLEAINRASIKALAASLGRLEGTTTRIGLYDWVRHEMLIATTEAIYGPYNPFRDPANEDAWYEFEDGIMLQMLQVHRLFPQGRSSFKARESLVKAFHRYFDQGCHLTPDVPSLSLVQTRYRHNVSHGLSPEDIARTEIGQVAASISNTIPAAFWMLWHVLSDPVVLRDCRREVEQLVGVDLIQQQKPDGQVVEEEVWTIDLAQLTSSAACPVLTSTWHEVLRFNHVGISARVVMQDTFLDKYLLKKGSTAMIVSPVMHSDVSVWGPSAHEFRHRRFTQTPSSNGYCRDASDSQMAYTATTNTKRTTNNNNLTKSPACRIFGGGSTLCPGRHFASQEVLSLLALTIMRFDVRPVSGRWVPPEKDIPLPTSLPIPQAARPGDLDFEITPRYYPGREWRVAFGVENANVAKGDL